MMTPPTDTDGGGSQPSLGGPDDPAYYEALGRAIRVLRTERGMERKDLAEAAGLSYPYLSEIETGKKRASSKALFVLAEALGVRPADLLTLGDRYAGHPLSLPVHEAASTPLPASPAPAGGSGYPSAGSPAQTSLAQSAPPAAAPAPTVAPPPAPPARASQRAGRWRWFERDEAEPMAAASGPPPAASGPPPAAPTLAATTSEEPAPRMERRAAAAPMASADDGTARRELLERLAETAAGLSDEDVAALLDLARRLGR